MSDKPNLAQQTLNQDAPPLKLTKEDFLLAGQEEKQSLNIMRESVGFWKDALRRLLRNPLAMASLAILIIVFVFAFIVPSFYPYNYKSQLRGHEDLGMMQYSADQLESLAAGERVFPHVLGTDSLGRDLAVRLMVGARISLIVGMGAAAIIAIIGTLFGAVSGFFGGKVDLVMMSIIDFISTVPDLLVIILLMTTLKHPLQKIADAYPSFKWINTLGVPIVCIFIVFAMLYWGSMARIVRGQILSIKENEYVTAARALGASRSKIILKHLLTNSIGTLIVATTLQIPSAIFTESFLSFLGIGVAAPLPSLGSLATQALGGLRSYPHRLFAPAILIVVIILTLNLFGDGLRDAFDPKLKK